VIIVTPRLATEADFVAAKTADVHVGEPAAADILLKGDTETARAPEPKGSK
jgi:hypothetical protein